MGREKKVGILWKVKFSNIFVDFFLSETIKIFFFSKLYNFDGFGKKIYKNEDNPIFFLFVN